MVLKYKISKCKICFVNKSKIRSIKRYITGGEKKKHPQRCKLLVLLLMLIQYTFFFVLFSSAFFFFWAENFVRVADLELILFGVIGPQRTEQVVRYVRHFPKGIVFVFTYFLHCIRHSTTMFQLRRRKSLFESDGVSTRAAVTQFSSVLGDGGVGEARGKIGIYEK